MEKLRAAIVCHDDATYLRAVIESLTDVLATVFVSRKAWGGQKPGPWEQAVEVATSSGATVVEGDWLTEADHRRFVLQWARAEGIRHLLIPDSDEILSAQLLSSLRKIASVELSDVVFCTMDTYWKSPEYVIRPRERLMPIIMIDPATAEHDHIRMFRGTRPLMISEEHGVLHHLSYSGPEARIARKISSWSHKDEVVPNWWRDVWTKWDGERNLGDLHPTVPEAYGFVERCAVPTELATAWEDYLSACGGSDPLHPKGVDPDKSAWPKISVVIPLYGGREDITLCLESLGVFPELLHEVIVVDDASPDDAPEVVADYAFATLVRNEKNLGFAGTCNRGASKATGDVLVFLNSDTVVPKVGFVELIRTLMKSGVIGAVGPVSNSAGHFQRIPACYQSHENIVRFAEDVALTDKPDLDCDMLVGLCLAVRRQAWEEVGPFDERFQVGMFEDNDLCYRLRRAGYRLVLAQRAFVHHKGHASLDRTNQDKPQLFATNLKKFQQKWTRDLELGFASSLAGLNADRIVFQEDRRPETIVESMRPLVERANVSLCMIVRDEERVLADCLESAKPFFSQIVIVDTGSTDRTIEIAKSFGAEVYEMEWPDSFSIARNESLKHATGDWICWLDADDTLPFRTGDIILHATTEATPDIGGLIIPVRFVNDDPEFGTTVDHVKVFRNHKGFEFELRIHEQILPSINEAGLNLMRLPGEVLHTGYDVSEEGQAKKRMRDDRLLKLDLKDRPNHPFVLFNLGMTAHFNGAHAEAADWLQQSISVSEGRESHVRKAYAMWTGSLRELGRLTEALQIVEKGLATVGDDPELFFHKAIVLSRLDRVQEAAACYEKTLSVGKGAYFSSVDSGIYGFRTLHNLAGLYAQMGDYEKARSTYVKACEANPRFLHSAFDLFDLALKHHDGKTCETAISFVQQQEGNSENVAKMRNRLH